MPNDLVFSWAENAEGQMVHVDSVPRGLLCGCFCPYCHEPLLARKGSVKAHGFAHHSEKRAANLKICYMVIRYKLAEQIVQQRKRIHVPSYYDIFPEQDIAFETVVIDSRYDRMDKQPDVVGTTKDGKQYLIEFTFHLKVQHKRSIDYNHLNCLEIDLAEQELEKLESFLLTSNKDRRWLNNDGCFHAIVERYQRAGKEVRVVDEEDECKDCALCRDCCAVKQTKWGVEQLIIENNGRRYRLCKCEQYAEKKEEQKKRIQAKEAERARVAKVLAAKKQEEEERRKLIRENQALQAREQRKTVPSVDSSAISCFNCRSNLRWANRGDGYANCGAWQSLGVPKRTPPNCAEKCKMFRPIGG